LRSGNSARDGRELSRSLASTIFNFQSMRVEHCETVWNFGHLDRTHCPCSGWLRGAIRAVARRFRKRRFGRYQGRVSGWGGGNKRQQFQCLARTAGFIAFAFGSRAMLIAPDESLCRHVEGVVMRWALTPMRLLEAVEVELRRRFRRRSYRRFDYNVARGQPKRLNLRLPLLLMVGRVAPERKCSCAYSRAGASHCLFPFATFSRCARSGYSGRVIPVRLSATKMEAPFGRTSTPSGRSLSWLY
jgi:hypothetical protein